MAEQKTRRERMRARGALFFTGREEQIKMFENALVAVEKKFVPPYENAKTTFSISGEGGIGKTWLCWEFERICKRKGIQSAYIDIARHEKPYISSLIDFMRICRRWFPGKKSRRLLGQEPFAEFDRELSRFLGLEEQLKKFKEKQSFTKEVFEQASDVGARLAVGLSKDLPFGETVTELIGKENAERVVKTLVRGGMGVTRDFLYNVFGKAKDVDFYLNHEEMLINKFTEGVENYVGKEPFVLLIDTYEEAMEIDISLRENLLENFPDSVIIVFSGRNSIYDNSSLSWREDTCFFELREFNEMETSDFLHKKGIKHEALIQSIFNFTRGVPLAIGLAVNAVEQLGDEQAAISLFSGEKPQTSHALGRRRIIEEMADRFLRLVPPEELDLIHTCVVLGQFRLEVLQALLKQELKLEQMKRIERYSFIRRPERDYLVHDTVR